MASAVAQRVNLWDRVPFALLVCVIVLGSARVGWGGNVSCVEIVRRANAYTSRSRGRVVDISELARKMGTSVTWVEHCLKAFGRRPKRPSLESHESREAELEALEESEPEESFAEDREEPGARERPPATTRPRYLSIKPTPGMNDPRRRDDER